MNNGIRFMLVACVVLSAVLGDMIGQATRSPLFPTCEAFSGRCEPGLVQIFNLLASLWFSLVVTTALMWVRQFFRSRSGR